MGTEAVYVQQRPDSSDNTLKTARDRESNDDVSYLHHRRLLSYFTIRTSLFEDRTSVELQAVNGSEPSRNI